MHLRFCSILLSTALLTGCANAADQASALAGSADVQLQATVAEGAKPLTTPLTWVVTRLRDGGAPGEVIATPTEAAPKLSLAPGHYVVSAKYGDAEAHEEIVVGAEDSRHVLDLNAGFIRLDMIPHAGAPVVTRDITWEVYRYAKGRGADEQLKVAEAVAPSKLFILPEGYYTLRARYAGTVADMVLPVTAGHRFNYTLNLYAGKVGLSAVAADGAVTENLTWQIVRAAPGKDGKREVVAKSVAASPNLLLREGRYVVLARSGSLTGEAPLEIKAGNTQTVQIKLKQKLKQVSDANG
jgi:hypothetical protein